MIEKYLRLNHHSRDTNAYIMRLDKIYKIAANKKTECRKDKNKLLLWYGCKLTNCIGILLNGFKILPPESPMIGYLFGKGIHFYDLSNKAIKECYASSRNNEIILLLCQVTMNDTNEITKTDFNSFQEKYHPLKCVVK